jgi:hypothetical protein
MSIGQAKAATVRNNDPTVNVPTPADAVEPRLR